MANFLVNKLTEDGLTGETTDMKSIFHNLMIIGATYKDAFLNYLHDLSLPYAVQICVCGRFVTYIELSKDTKSGVILFFDCQNNNDLALDAAAKISDRWYGGAPNYLNWFMEEYIKLKEVYEDNYDAAELIMAENAGLLLN